MDTLARLLERLCTAWLRSPSDPGILVARHARQWEAIAAQAKRCAALTVAAESLTERAGLDPSDLRTLIVALRDAIRAAESRCDEARRWLCILSARRRALREGWGLQDKLGAAVSNAVFQELARDLALLEQNLKDQLPAAE
jgi:hypothetical protein